MAPISFVTVIQNLFKYVFLNDLRKTVFRTKQATVTHSFQRLVFVMTFARVILSKYKSF